MNSFTQQSIPYEHYSHNSRFHTNFIHTTVDSIRASFTQQSISYELHSHNSRFHTNFIHTTVDSIRTSFTQQSIPYELHSHNTRFNTLYIKDAVYILYFLISYKHIYILFLLTCLVKLYTLRRNNYSGLG